MPTYQLRGDVPRKRHIQFRDNGRLLTEEVMGLEGFSGNESILYHLTSPCRIKELGDFEPIKRDEWVPDAHVHRHMATMGLEPEGDAIVAHAARNTRLRAGDVLGSGTVGTGCILEHGDGRWLQRGDVVELEIEGFGVLRYRVAGD